MDSVDIPQLNETIEPIRDVWPTIVMLLSNVGWRTAAFFESLQNYLISWVEIDFWHIGCIDYWHAA